MQINQNGEIFFLFALRLEEASLRMAIGWGWKVNMALREELPAGSKAYL